MANEQNLRPQSSRTKSEQREIQSKGGKASGISRGFRSAVRKRLKDNPELVDEIIDSLIDAATNEHDLKATELLIELAGESARQQDLKLKKQELKIKKENAEAQNW